MRNVRVKVAYDGSRFFGWQRQSGFESVQEALEDALLALTGDAVTVHGAGRTDTGVHAVGQVANFHLDTRLDDDRLLHALNAHLPEGVVLRRLETCRDDFHARFDARGKRYVYRTVTARFRPPFGREYAHFCREPLDLAAMRAAAGTLVGEHDFSAFESTGSPRSSSVRRLASVRVLARREVLLFAFQANGFLYNMARALAGTLLDVGRGRRTPADVVRALESRDRTQAGPTAPPEGLLLVSVLYDEPVLVGRHAGPSGAAGAFPDRPTVAPSTRSMEGG